jgi:DNA replication and repair protein RecF
MLALHAVSARPAAGPPRRVAAVRRLKLDSFRNYVALDLRLGREPVVLSGENGSGKTNLLEAVSLLAPGRGLRRARLGELDREGGGPWAVVASVDTAHGAAALATAHDRDQDRRAVWIDGGAVRGSRELGEVLGVLWLTPAHDRLFQEGPAARRRFADRLVMTLDPGHAARLAAYDRTLRERSLALRSARPDGVWLDVLERRFAETASAVAAARLELVAALDAILAETALPFPQPRVRLSGDLEAWLASGPAVEAEERLATALRSARETDRLQGGAGHGPHRSDLEVTDAETGRAARDCSTGRQKSLLLALVLAAARLRLERIGELPVLLLDEVAAHLDGRRRAELFASLAELGAQTWLTGTDAVMFAPLRGRAQHYNVQHGSLDLR